MLLCSQESKASLPLDQATINSSDPEYYNDLPGKIPPEMVDTELCQNYVITLKVS